MSLVGKLIKRAATVIANQPWTDLVFPASCISCHQELSSQWIEIPETTPENTSETNHELSAGCSLSSTSAFLDWQTLNWCQTCWTKLRPKSKHACRKCGAHLFRPSPFDGGCANCLQAHFKFDQAIAVGNYEGLVRDLVIRMKNRHDDVLAIHLGKRLAFELLGQGLTEFDQLVPVPLHWSRRLKRGFQATEILSDQISRITGIPQCLRTLQIVRATAKQGTLSASARQANVRNAFSVLRKSRCKGARVLLVDDVMTTGATASEIARVLKAAGASHVGVAVIARGGAH